VKLDIADPSLVVLVGPSGSGKSTFAQTHFRATEILSSDWLRAMLTDDPNDQDASREAFAILARLLQGRLQRRLLTVVDATNLRAGSRRRWLSLAARFGLPAIAIVFDLPDQIFLAHDQLRPDRQVGREVVTFQTELLRESLAEIPQEGFSAFYVLRKPPALGGLSVERLGRSG
jgi:protein phosphatase